MKSFRNHVAEETLMEKVSQKEYNEAEKDKNIRIGIEFEVVDSQLTASGRSGYDMDDVESDYDAFVTQIVDYADEICDSRDEYYEEIESDKRERLSNIEDERDEKEESVRHLDDEIDEIRQRISDLEDEQSDADEERYDELQSDIDEYEDRINSLESDKEDLEIEVSDLQDEYDRIDEMYGEEYGEEFGLGEWDGPNPPYFSADKYEDWLSDMGESIPDQQEIVSWCFEATEYGTDRIGAYDVTSSRLMEYLPYPSEDYYEDGEGFDEDSDAYHDLVKNVTGGKDPEVGGYHASSNYNKWRIEEDSSLNSGGAEIISPILTLQDGMKAIENMFDWIDEYADTDSSCGFHINMSFDGYDMSKFDWLKLLFFVEEGAIYKKFDDRKNNGYAKPIHDYLNSVQRNPEDIGSKAYFQALSKAESQGFSAVKEKIGAGKFFGVNFSSIMHGSSNGRIEFRYMGGRYHKKLKQVKQQILQYAAWMKIALDPKYKRQEYLKKLAKFAQGANERVQAVNDRNSQTHLGTSHGQSGDQVWDLYFDERKKLIVVLGAGNKPVKAMKLTQALRDRRVKQFLLVNGYVIKDLIKGRVTQNPSLGRKYMDALKKANPKGEITAKEMEEFILSFKQ